MWSGGLRIGSRLLGCLSSLPSMRRFLVWLPLLLDHGELLGSRRTRVPAEKDAPKMTESIASYAPHRHHRTRVSLVSSRHG